MLGGRVEGDLEFPKIPEGFCEAEIEFGGVRPRPPRRLNVSGDVCSDPSTDMEVSEFDLSCALGLLANKRLNATPKEEERLEALGTL